MAIPVYSTVVASPRTWRRLPIALLRVKPIRWALLVLSALASAAQSDNKAPVFDVIAIRPTDPSAMRNQCYMRGQPGGQTFTGRCIPLSVILKYAYKIVDGQIGSAPDWTNTQLYDFDAKVDHPVTRADVAGMMQAFLADRFNLKFHKETRTMQAFVLSIDRSGNKMTANSTEYEWEIPVQFVPATLLKVKGIRCPMYYLSWWIGQQNNRPVVDRTGLTGFWDFTLEYLPDSMQGRTGPNGEPVDGPSLATALKQQLGLKLDSEKTQVDVYVIDHVEKAAAN